MPMVSEIFRAAKGVCMDRMDEAKLQHRVCRPSSFAGAMTRCLGFLCRTPTLWRDSPRVVRDEKGPALGRGLPKQTHATFKMRRNVRLCRNAIGRNPTIGTVAVPYRKERPRERQDIGKDIPECCRQAARSAGRQAWLLEPELARPEANLPSAERPRRERSGNR